MVYAKAYIDKKHEVLTTNLDTTQNNFKNEISTTVQNIIDNNIEESVNVKINNIVNGTTVVAKSTEADKADEADLANMATYASSDTSKGTIEERLTNLGYKSGSVSVTGGTAGTNSIDRYPNVCMKDFVWNAPVDMGSYTPTLVVGSNFLPNVTTKTLIGYAYCGIQYTQSGTVYTATDKVANVYINSDGTITLSDYVTGTAAYTQIKFKVAYMAKPL